METAGIRAAALAHVGNEERSKCARATPSCKHQTVDWPNILRPEVVGGKRRHGAKSTAVAHQDDERQNRKNRRRRCVWQYPEETDLKQWSARPFLYQF